MATSPFFARPIRQWLKAGVVDQETFMPTQEGTPQGGVLSPLLANIALHGLEDVVKKAGGPVEFIPIKPLAATDSSAPGSYAAHNRVPSPDADPLLPQTDAVLHDAAALDTPVDMLDAQPPLVERMVRPLLLPRERLAAGFHGIVI